MPIHDWSRVDAGIIHAFHSHWLSAISDALNNGVLPDDFYAMPEQHAAGFGPDIVALQGDDRTPLESSDAASGENRSAGVLMAAPRQAMTAESDMAFYRRKQMPLVIRHVSGDRVVALIELVSPGNKSSRHAFRSFVEKAGELLDNRIHLMVLDLIPPGPRDPRGIHAAIWDEIAGRDYSPPSGKLLTLASYEAALAVRAYVQHVAVGDALPEMPLFLEPDGCVQTPLEATYLKAFSSMPQRWRRVLNEA